MSGFWIVIALLFLLGFCQSSASPATRDVVLALPDATSDDTQANDKATVVLITEHQHLLLLQNGKEIYSQSLSDLQLPKISAIYETATMEVVNNTAYVGGFDGNIYQINISLNETEVSVNVSTVKLNLPCIAEVFASNGHSVITACFGHENNTLYVVNVHSPTERSELKFTSMSDFSNILAFGNVFYYAQSNNLFRGDTSQQRVVEIFQNCLQPLLIKHKSCCIIIQCSNKSHVFVPPELGSLPGKREGIWEDKKIYPCHGNGSAPFIFSTNRSEITIFDIRNDFQSTITLNGAPEVSTITCAWSNNDLVLFYKENTCDCWIRYKLNNNLEFKDSTEVLLSQGTLHPLSTSKGDIDQSVLMFYPDVLRFLMLPSKNQVMVDLKTGLFYTNITNNVVLYHSMIFESLKADGGETGKKGSTDTPIKKKSHSWTVYVGVPVAALVLLTSILVMGIVSCYYVRRRHRCRSELDIAVRIPTEVTDEDSPNHTDEKVITQETNQAYMASSIV